MDDLKALLRETGFRERLRGYDCKEVDAYVSSVHHAVAQATAYLDEMRERVERAEAESSGSDVPGSDMPASGKQGGHEQSEAWQRRLERTLVLAQRTADEVTAEAESKAAEIVSEARNKARETSADAQAAADSRMRMAKEQAELVIAEAQSEAAAVVGDAKNAAVKEAETARTNIVKQIRILTHTRDELRKEASALKSQRDAHTRQLGLLWRSLCSFAAEVDLELEIDRLDSGHSGLPSEESALERARKPGGATGSAHAVAESPGATAAAGAEAASAGSAVGTQEAPTGTPGLPARAGAPAASKPGRGKKASSARRQDRSRSAKTVSGRGASQKPAPRMSAASPAGSSSTGMAAASEAPPGSAEPASEMPMPAWRDDAAASPRPIRKQSEGESSSAVRPASDASREGSERSSQPRVSGKSRSAGTGSVVRNPGISKGTIDAATSESDGGGGDGGGGDGFVEQLRQVVRGDRRVHGTHGRSKSASDAVKRARAGEESSSGEHGDADAMADFFNQQDTPKDDIWKRSRR